jgi:methyl-accepting chemotaxis protein
MKTRTYGPAVWCACLAMMLLGTSPASAAAQTNERISDNDVRKVIEDLNQSRDRFEDQLDGDLKRSIIRGPTGELSVERYLDDLQENVKNLKDRFTSEYSASKEAHTVLRQGTEIANYFKKQTKIIRGQSEFDRMSVDLGRLATAYGTTFPLPDLEAPVRRINDAETAAAANELGRQADNLKREIDREKTLPQPAKDAAKKDLDALKRTANTVKDRAGDSKPASAEAQQLVAMCGKIGSFIQGQTGLAPTTLSAFGAMQAPLDKLKQAYSLR